MRFVFGFAGIPVAVYDQVYKRRNTIVGGNAEFFGRTWKAKYELRDADPFLDHFHGRVAEDHHSALRDTAFAMICINHGEEDTQAFARRFFPSTFVTTVDWQLAWGAPQAVAQSGNQLIGILGKAVKQAKVALEALKKEVNERANRTPLLLPPKNFRSGTLVECLAELHRGLGELPAPVDLIATQIQAINKAHPLKDDDTSKLKFYLDDRGITFRAPGMAKHAMARANAAGNGHDKLCTLNGRRRFGAPFDPGFHYDCQKGKGKLKDNFFECHGHNENSVVGNPHLNIAPNDNIRP